MTVPVKCLLVDDLDKNLLALSALLRRDGVEILEARTGSEALELLLVHDVALALLDVQMPDMDGFELAELMRGSERTRRVPIIFVTAGARDQHRLFKGYETGAVDFLYKPIEPHVLRSKADVFFELYRARAEAIQANQAKDEFLAMLGHELRNPLAPMRLALTTLRSKLQKGQDPGRQIEILDRQTESLSRIVNDLLDVARVTRGMVELRTELVELAPLLERALDGVQPIIEQKGHAVSLTLPPERIRVVADPVRLEQVVVNLLTNAAKYTDPGGDIAVCLATSDGAFAEIRVKDTGIGIHEEMLGRVFDLFEQASRDLDRAQGGLGIGLTIVKNLVQLHGGTLEARSAGLGKGSEFIVRLPVSSVAPESESPPVADKPVLRPAAASAAEMRVLVVEDSRDAADAIAETLKELGHQVRVVHEGPAAVEVAREATPDLVLLDIGLPVMDGYEVARRLRGGAAPGAFLVALTGYGRAQDKERALQAGFDRHMVKPITWAALKTLTEEVARCLIERESPR